MHGSCRTDASMSLIARCVFALCMPLAMPWPGPHMDRYTALLLVAVNAPAEGAGAAFWGLWAALWAAYAAGWFILLSLARVLWRSGS